MNGETSLCQMNINKAGVFRMKKFSVFVACFLVLVSVITVCAADQPKVTVKLTSDELAFAVSTLNSVELTGEEVSAFMEVKNDVVNAYKEISASKKSSGDVTFTVAEAKNFLYFMRRVKLKGAEASIFNEVTNKIIDTLKKEAK